MKLVHKNHLGINEVNGMAHVDNWEDKRDCYSKTLCGRNPDNYNFVKNENILKVKSICKTCQRKALKTGKCLVTTIATMKLKK